MALRSSPDPSDLSEAIGSALGDDATRMWGWADAKRMRAAAYRYTGQRVINYSPRPASLLAKQYAREISLKLASRMSEREIEVAGMIIDRALGRERVATRRAEGLREDLNMSHASDERNADPIEWFSDD